MVKLQNGDKVSWTTQDGKPGWGFCVGDEENGHVMVEVHQLRGEPQEVHTLIRCTVTWLTKVVEAA